MSSIKNTNSEEPEVVASSEEVKTSIQITQFSGPKYCGSHSFRIPGRKAMEIMKFLAPLLRIYPVLKKPSYRVRLQLFEFRNSNGAYRKQRGGTLTLHAAYVYDVAKWVEKVLSRNGILGDRDGG